MEIKCQCCGENIERKSYEGDKRFSQRMFCSYSCSSKSKESRYKKGQKVRLGSKHSEESKKKISEAKKKHYKKLKEQGLKHHRWKGGYENKLYHNRRRRVLKLKNGGSHSLQDWLDLKEKNNYTCLFCGLKEPDITLSEDHIIPLSKGGTDNIDNIQPLCRSCNSKKHNN